MNINNLLMPLIGADVYAVISVIVGVGLLGTFGFFAIKNLVYAIQGKPVKRWIIRRRSKGEQKLVVKDKQPAPTPKPIEEEVEEKKIWPKKLGRIRIRAIINKSKRLYREQEEGHDCLDNMFKRVKNYVNEQFENDSVKSFEFTFAIPEGKFGKNANILEFNVRKGPKSPKYIRQAKKLEIDAFLTELETYFKEHDGEITEEDCKIFEEKAASLNESIVAARKVKVEPGKEANGATFIEDLKNEQKNVKNFSETPSFTTVNEDGIISFVFEDEKIK